MIHMRYIQDTKGKFFRFRDLVAFPIKEEQEPDIIDLANGIIDIKPARNFHGNALSYLQENNSLVKKAENRLAAIGETEFSYFNMGGHAFLTELKDQEGEDKPWLRRISINEQVRPYHPAILQASNSMEFSCLRFERMPKIKTEGVNSGHIKMLRKVIQFSGITPDDIGEENIGLIDDVPHLFDAGKLIIIPNYTIPPEIDFSPWVGRNEQWLQFKAFPELAEGRSKKHFSEVLREQSAIRNNKFAKAPG